MNEKESITPTVQEKKPSGMALVYQRLHNLEESMKKLSDSVESLKAVVDTWTSKTVSKPSNPDGESALQCLAREGLYGTHR
jgi:hypothetical protein